jgi:uncharacterized LabA/DUF88 family protein
MAPRRLRPTGFFLSTLTVSESTALPNKRLVCLVDGFNLYHSLLDAEEALRSLGGVKHQTKWVDIWRMLDSHKSQVRGAGRVELSEVYHFTALAHHVEQRKPGVVARHNTYVDALRSSGVTVVFGRFKEVQLRPCRSCGTPGLRHEEKETDVAIAAKLLKVLHADEADAVMIVSGDSDLVPAIQTARDLFPTKPVGCLFPFKRAKSRTLRDACSFYASIGKEQYPKFQFPDPIVLPSGGKIAKPKSW